MSKKKRNVEQPNQKILNFVESMRVVELILGNSLDTILPSRTEFPTWAILEVKDKDMPEFIRLVSNLDVMSTSQYDLWVSLCSSLITNSIYDATTYYMGVRKA